MFLSFLKKILGINPQLIPITLVANNPSCQSGIWLNELVKEYQFQKGVVPNRTNPKSAETIYQ